jgi:alpha-glucosidase
LIFDYQHDPAVRDVDDQYLLGADLLVAPVVHAGQTARQVYLPEGGWYDWHTGQPVGQRRYLLTPTPMDRIPIYARAGALIPMWSQAPASTSGHHPTTVELHLFVPLADGVTSALLQEDDGQTFAAESGQRYRTTFEVSRRGRQVTVTAGVDGAGYHEFAREAFHLVVHGAEPATVELDGSEVPMTDGHFVLPNAGAGFTVALTV